jgi:predicted TIM-barrel fold metal-dependent hydrolase
MEKRPNLRINFAHFGGGDNLIAGDTVWLEKIVEILKKYPNAYTDISYFTKPGLAKKIDVVVAQYPILEKRLMFGTDFVMIMMDTHLGGLKAYFNRFDGLKSNFLTGNALAFLKK